MGRASASQVILFVILAHISETTVREQKKYTVAKGASENVQVPVLITLGVGVWDVRCIDPMSMSL